MEPAPTSAGGGGPAPFLLKTYEMVDDSTTDDIVSWSGSRKSFVVWNPPEFARVLLPTYFKHNNFSSFIRQLNTYGFRKIDPERWEFANDDFVKDQKHLLKNIHRRKPMHSHSHPQGSVDSERAAFEEEIEKLSREKTALEGNVLAFKQQQSAAKVQFESLTKRIGSMEQRQERLLTFLDKAVQNPEFVERLAQKLESMDFLAYNKKRRLPQVDNSHTTEENALVDNYSSSRHECGNIFHQDFCNKLRLELSPAASDINLLSHSTQSSNEDGGSPLKRIEARPKDAHVRTGGVMYAPETLELSDTGTSFSLKMDSTVSCKAGAESSRPHPLQQCLTSNDDIDGNFACHLNLTLASSPLEFNKSQSPPKNPHSGEETVKEPRASANGGDLRSPVSKPRSDDGVSLSSSHEDPNKKQGPATAKVQVNDMFWEQFLTERPGCSDTEEASSSFRENTYDEREGAKSIHGTSRSTENVERLTL